MKHNIPKNPRECLDQRAQALAHKHHRRLQQMTHQALEARQAQRSRWIKPTMATAFSLLLITTVVFLYQQDDQHGNKTATQPLTTTQTALPVWLTDTDVPLTLIENLEFYHWLSQQKDKQYAQNQSPLIVAFNEYDRYRFSQRLSPRNLTERFSGTTSHVGGVQK